MLKILWKGGEIAPGEQFLLLSTIFSYLMLDFYVKTRVRFSLRDKRLFEITEVEITRVDCKYYTSFFPPYDVINAKYSKSLRLMGVPPCFSAIITKGNNPWLPLCFPDSWYPYKKDLLPKERNCRRKSKYL